MSTVKRPCGIECTGATPGSPCTCECGGTMHAILHLPPEQRPGYKPVADPFARIPAPPDDAPFF